MDWRQSSERIGEVAASDPVAGQVVWSPVKSLWIGGMTAVALVAGPMTFSWDAVLVFLLLTGVTLCAGHSVGMHRRLIHRSFECPQWLEYILVYLGTLVGMAGPFGMTWQHDVRDWAQRQAKCHPYLRHGVGFWRDAWWQLHCELRLERPPAFRPEFAADPVYRWMEATWMLQQLPVAILLYAFGGWAWVVWGVCARVAVSVTGHWLVGHFAHNYGPMSFRVRGAGVQGRDVPIAALLSMGESWHNNHHAFPGSAKLGLFDDQPDPGYWFILVLRRVGLAWSVQTPETLPKRTELEPANADPSGCSVLRAIRKRRTA